MVADLFSVKSAAMLKYHSGYKGYDFKLSAETHAPRKEKEQTCQKPEVDPVSTGSPNFPQHSSTSSKKEATKKLKQLSGIGAFQSSLLHAV